MHTIVRVAFEILTFSRHKNGFRVSQPEKLQFSRDAVQKLALTQYACPANTLAVPLIECIDCCSVYLNI